MAMVDIHPSVPRTAFPQRYEALSPEDFETASVRSAAPSYISEAPSYQSQNIPNEPAPPYAPREDSSTPTPARRTNPAALRPSRTSGPVFVPPPSGLTMSPSAEVSSGYRSGTPSTTSSAALRSASARDSRPSAESLPTTGIRAIPHVARAAEPGVPNLAEFRIPTIAANPSARHYFRVAQRRSQAAAAAADAGFALRMLLERVEEEESRRVRPLEDPYLVGEVEARRARERRVARDEGGDRALEREGRRWDWFLGQVRDWDERDRRANSPGGPPLSDGGAGEGSARPRRHRGRLGLFGRR